MCPRSTEPVPMEALCPVDHPAQATAQPGYMLGLRRTRAQQAAMTAAPPHESSRAGRRHRRCRKGTPAVTPTDAATAPAPPRRCSTLAPPRDRPAPPLATVHTGCKQKSNSVAALDQTAGAGAEEPRCGRRSRRRALPQPDRSSDLLEREAHTSSRDRFSSPSVRRAAIALATFRSLGSVVSTAAAGARVWGIQRGV